MLKLVDCSHVRIDGMRFVDARCGLEVSLSDEVDIVNCTFSGVRMACKVWDAGEPYTICDDNEVQWRGCCHRACHRGALPPYAAWGGYVVCLCVYIASALLWLELVTGWPGDRGAFPVWREEDWLYGAAIAVAANIVLLEPAWCVVAACCSFAHNNLEPIEEEEWTISEEINPKHRHTKEWSRRRNRMKADGEWVEMSRNSRRYYHAVAKENVQAEEEERRLADEEDRASLYERTLGPASQRSGSLEEGSQPGWGRRV